ncbi:hypothetical protein LY76DRAFT_308962 [Colletotrichum caudatum]|nr:hypothetical protein LY76DRAFT_308962 [Colletotrichum caudatum]
MNHAWDGKPDKTVVASRTCKGRWWRRLRARKRSGLSSPLDDIVCFVRAHADGPGWLIEAQRACHHAPLPLLVIWPLSRLDGTILYILMMGELGKCKRRSTSDDTTWAFLARWETPAGMCLLRSRGWQILSDPISTARCQFATICLIHQGGIGHGTQACRKWETGVWRGSRHRHTGYLNLHDIWLLRRQGPRVTSSWAIYLV